MEGAYVCCVYRGCFLPTCASSHVGLKEKAVVASQRQEAAAAVETPEDDPTPEGTTPSLLPVWMMRGAELTFT